MCTRTIQIDCRADQLNSGFSYILRRPFAVPDESDCYGIVYCWIGNQSDPYYHTVVKEVCDYTLFFKLQIMVLGGG